MLIFHRQQAEQITLEGTHQVLRDNSVIGFKAGCSFTGAALLKLSIRGPIHAVLTLSEILCKTQLYGSGADPVSRHSARK